MTKEEIKQQTDMKDILSEYGIAIVRGMCRCPFHDDRKPSMKVYKDGVRCFTCAKSWDVFAFVMDMDGISFLQAFKKLGGETDTSSRSRALFKARQASQQALRNRAQLTNKQMRKALRLALSICEYAGEIFEPYSDEWCFLQDKKPIIEYMYDERIIKGELKEWSDLDVLRECKSITERFLLFP